MLREIKREELMKQIGKDVIIVSLMGGTVRTLEEILEGSRILVDEKEKEPVENEKPKKKKVTDSKKDHRDKEQMILKAWRGGERTIKEIMEETGCSYATVRKYIPTTVNG